ncbi:hypothetical protein [Ruminococcus flavefaciens]|uniref:Uncharacterized protein n=1 Tax=Ruminococcus flavefaciens TaxID=1265 RepID=A0A315XTG6_RUMFL|nr:hypothetical protein [Ruminococcus flavefaciens]PWJ09642.1 hypothetical protein IE37_03461 [Ruminococcus flavefaciens]SSA52307.1 hypothetical protein SAMN02910325_03461 [Ruminococcus flavefaciens]
MKLKRIAFLTSLALCATAVTSLVASAAAEGTVSDGGAYLDGWVCGVEGPNVLTDKIWYNGYLYGSDAQYVEQYGSEVYVQPGTDGKTLDKVYLWNTRRVVSGNKVSCGWGADYARLKIHCGSDETTLSERLA